MCKNTTIQATMPMIDKFSSFGKNNLIKIIHISINSDESIKLLRINLYDSNH